MPVTVPPVPTLAHEVRDPALGLVPDLRAGGPLVGVGFSVFQYWSGLNAPGMSRASRAATE